jgi:DNA-binding response OmpR family regulator
LYRLNLEAEGIEVSEAGDGETALALVRSERPDLIVLDLMMPRLDGWAVAEQLLEDPQTRAIPIVFASARAGAAERARGLELGGIAYVLKPFNPVELAASIHRLAKPETQQESHARRRERLRQLRALLEAAV